MLRTLVLLVVVTMCLTACETVQVPWARSNPSALDDGMGDPLVDSGLSMSPDQRFPEVPLPMDVNEDRERTFVYESASVQLGRMVYRTKNSVSDLANFYIREAPAAGWKVERALQISGAELVFSKPGKRLTVNIEDKGIGRGRILTLLYVPDSGAAGAY